MGDNRWLPTSPGTHLEFSVPHLWTTDSKCKICRVMRLLRLWELRDKHIIKRHRPPLQYVSGGNYPG